MFPDSLPAEDNTSSLRGKPSLGYTVGRVLIALLIGIVILGAASSLAIIMSGGPGAPPALIGFMTHAGFLILSFAIMLVLGRGRLAGFGIQAIQGAFPGKAIAGALGLGIAATLIQLLLPESDFNPVAGFSPLQIILLVWIWASLAEEVLVRGLLQSYLHPLQGRGINLGGVKLSLPVIFSGCFFSAMHLLLLTTGVGITTVLLILVFALVLGLLAGHYRQQTQSLLPAVLIHLCGNVGESITAWIL